MERNLGKADRVTRFFLGTILVFVPLANLPPVWTQSWMAIVSMGVGAVLIATSLIKFCPLYRLFGLRTC